MPSVENLVQKPDNLGGHVANAEISLNDTRSKLHPAVSQFIAMVRRNMILNRRFWRATLARAIISPILFILVLFLLQHFYVIKQSKSLRHPPSRNLQPVAKCEGEKSSSPCISILFAPDVAYNRLIMSAFASKNAERGSKIQLESITLADMTPPSSQLGIVGAPTSDFIYDYVLTNQNTTRFGVSFSRGAPSTTYQIWLNTTLMRNESDSFAGDLLSLQRGLDEAILAVYTSASNANDINSLSSVSGSADFDYTIKDWPIVPPDYVPDELVKNLGSIFFFCAVMIIFIATLQNITTEKELRLRHAMQVMGLRAYIYWWTTFLNEMLIVFIATIVTIVMGYICRFDIFINTNFFVLFFLFFLYGMAMVCFGFLITTFCRTSRAAVLFGMFFFVIGMLFQSLIFSSSFAGYVWFADFTPAGFYAVMRMIPFFNFGVLFLGISLKAVGKFDLLTQTAIPGPGFKFGDLSAEIPLNVLPSYFTESTYKRVPLPRESLYMLLMNVIVYSILTWYFDKVFPDEFGKFERPWFLLSPYYWGYRAKSNSPFNDFKKRAEHLGRRSEFQIPNEDDAVVNERKVVFDTAYKRHVRIGNLRKVYRNSMFFATKEDKVAVRSLCLSLQEGRLLALLGQNGAGKSTTMSCLSGLTPSTAGDALMYDLSVKNDMALIRELMGICPQHDILFNDLTAMEHIQLYGSIKNLSQAEINRVAEERLVAVRLIKVKNQPAGTYSGGMKRRLSVLISTLGDPKIIFLDEPTTGMDPVNRRHVWSFLEKFKENRVMVLTTHSMEEADVLGDEVAIMVKGKLRALGTGVGLKSQYGDGYRISIIAHLGASREAKSLVKNAVPEAIIEDDSAGSLIYRMPPAALDRIPAFISTLEEAAKRNIVDSWGLSQTTLEEVFLKLIREENAPAAH